MKLVKVIVALCALSSLAHAVEMFPAHYPMCKDFMSNGEEDCFFGRSMHVGDDGQCACLEGKEFFSPEKCRRAMIRCDEGTKFSSIYRMSMVSGKMEQQYKGCGCIKTVEAVCPLSL